MIELNQVVKSYGSHQVLQGINLKVHEGEIYGFIGHNGSGKSTTMNILAGLIGFQKGHCMINHNEVQKGKTRRTQDVGYLPEDPKFYPYMNPWEYLTFIGIMVGDSKEKIKMRSVELLDMVKLTEASKRAIGGYSRGMKQRLGIAVAMYHDPKVLLLDEPSSALDPEGRMDVIDIISELKSEGKTIFLSTHILNDIEKICDKVGILHNGQIVLEEKLETLMKSYIQPVYDIEFDSPLDKEKIKVLRSVDYLENVIVDRKGVSIWIKDYKENGSKLIQLLGSLSVPIISMTMRRNSLEEIFLKVVK